MTGPSLQMTAVLQPAPLDGRRGVVRMHAATMQSLGLRPWGCVEITGGRRTAALVALAPEGTAWGHLLCDELVLRNANARDAAPLQVRPVQPLGATGVVVSGAPGVTAVVSPDLLRSALLGKVVLSGDEVSLLVHDVERGGPVDPAAATQSLARRLGPAWTSTVVRVEVVQPVGPVLVTAGTAVSWAGGPGTAGSLPPPEQRAAAPVPPAPTVEDLPGLEKQVGALREWLDLAFAHPELLTRLGASPSTGVVVTGAAGSGKAALAEAAAAAVGAALVRVWCPEVAALEPTSGGQRLTALLTSAAQPRPTVLLLEDLEALAPRSGGPLLATLLTGLRDLLRDGRTAVVATTSRPEDVDPAVRAKGLLDRELSIPLPDRGLRLRLLEHALRAVPVAADVHLDDVAAKTPGFVSADLQALVREAGLRAAARQREAESPTVAQEDLVAALDVVRPTTMEGATLDLAPITLDDVGDMAEVKQALAEAVLWPLQYPDTFTRLGVAPPRGVLLYGPPGTGKTFVVKALAGSGQANVLSVKGAELLSKWVGESERAVRELFRRAREAAPTLVFLDEVDALAPVRGKANDAGTTDRVVAALLTELDGVESLRDVVVIGATNRPDLVDPALLRPGRLERLVFVPPPDAEARSLILTASAKAVPLAPDVDLAALGARTEGYSAADCAALVREAALGAMRESMEASVVTAAHLEAALGVVRPSLDPAQVAHLQAFAQARAAR